MSAYRTAGERRRKPPEAFRIEPDFVGFILRTMAQRAISQRQLAEQAGIGKSRIGVLLHSDPDRRAMMSVAELQCLLRALESDVVRAAIRSGSLQQLDPPLLERHEGLIAMLCDAFVSLPHAAIAMIEELEGVDGSEIRREWADGLRRAVCTRLAEIVRETLARRTRLAQGEEFRI